MTKEFEKRLAENANQITINNSQECTDAEFSYILFLCKQGIPIGFGALDSFLSGPDLAKRVKLIEKAVLQDENLKRELIDTLSLDQSNDWSKEYYDILCKVAGINASLEKQE